MSSKNGFLLHLNSNVIIIIICYWIVLPADAAGGEEEPVHEDAGAVIVGVIGEQPVPLVALLARTISRAAGRALLSEGSE